jgi:hypothetical protein
MADFDNFDAIGLSGEADPLFLRRYPLSWTGRSVISKALWVSAR